MTSAKVSRAKHQFLCWTWLPWRQLWPHNVLLYQVWHSGLSTGCRRKHQQENFRVNDSQSPHLITPTPPHPPIANRGSTSQTLGLPPAPGSVWGAGNPLATAQNVRLVTEILDGFKPPGCGRGRFVVAVVQLWWRAAPRTARLTCESIVDVYSNASRMNSWLEGVGGGGAKIHLLHTRAWRRSTSRPAGTLSDGSRSVWTVDSTCTSQPRACPVSRTQAANNHFLGSPGVHTLGYRWGKLWTRFAEGHQRRCSSLTLHKRRSRLNLSPWHWTLGTAILYKWHHPSLRDTTEVDGSHIYLSKAVWRVVRVTGGSAHCIAFFTLREIFGRQ